MSDLLSLMQFAAKGLDLSAFQNDVDNQLGLMEQLASPVGVDRMMIESSASSKEVSRLECFDDLATADIIDNSKNSASITATLIGGDNTTDISTIGPILRGLKLNGIDDSIENDDVIPFLIGTDQSGVFGSFKFTDVSGDFQTLFSFGDTDAGTLIVCMIDAANGKFQCLCVDSGVNQWKFTTDNVLLVDATFQNIFFGHDGNTPIIWVDGFPISQDDLTYSVGTVATKKKWFSSLTAGIDNARIGSRLNSGGAETGFLDAVCADFRWVDFLPEPDDFAFVWNNGFFNPDALGKWATRYQELTDLSGTHTHTHASTTGQTEDDHHDKSHSHDGVDGSGTVAHTDITGQTVDDHHNQSHAHDGIDGSGTVAHTDVTGQTANDHHNEDHAARHILGGADEIDGDQVGIDFTPSNYTPSTSPPEVTSVDQASAHYAGIDDELGIIAANRVTTSFIRFKADGTKPSESDIAQITGFELPNNKTKGIDGDFRILSGITLTVDPLLTFSFVVSKTGAGAANVRLQVEARYVAVGEQIDKAVDETILITKAVVDVLEEEHQVAFSLDRTLMAASDRVVLNLTRLGSDGLDTYTGDIVVNWNIDMFLRFSL